MLSKYKSFHFVAIGGIGMSAIAHILLKKGFKVSGSDLQENFVTQALEKNGVKIFFNHHQSNLKNAEALIISTAINADNVEVQEAKKMGIPIFHRSEVLAELLKEKKGIAVAGAHGKTTTTAMMSLVLENAKLDPTALIGGILDIFNGNAKYGKGEYIVVEADESDGSFLRLAPNFIIITNIENDHMDYYGNMKNVKKAFKDFLVSLKEKGGLAVINADDQETMSVASNVDIKKVTYGIKQRADYEAKNIINNGLETKFAVYKDGQHFEDFHLYVPGIHNVSNALAVITLADCLEVDKIFIKKGLADFHGTKRRFQIKGKLNNIVIVDDYAHHPTEIKATLKAAKGITKGRVITVFQPHRYTRTNSLKDDFALAFEDADIAVFTDIYAASEKPITGINGQTLPKRILELTGKEVLYIKEKGHIARYLNEIVENGDLVITLGAGNIYTVGEELLDILLEKNI